MRNKISKYVYNNNLSKDSPSNQAIIITKGDRAESYHYWKQEDANELSNLKHNTFIKVILSNTEAIPSNLRGEILLLSQLLVPAQIAIVLPQLKDPL